MKNLVIIQEWFDLYQSIKAKYGILDKNTYNIDENSYIIGIAGSFQMIFSKYKKQAFIKEAINRKWKFLMETISISGWRLTLFVIFKGKK